jgi:hypothetical protein
MATEIHQITVNGVTHRITVPVGTPEKATMEMLKKAMAAEGTEVQSMAGRPAPNPMPEPGGGFADTAIQEGYDADKKQMSSTAGAAIGDMAVTGAMTAFPPLRGAGMAAKIGNLAFRTGGAAAGAFGGSVLGQAMYESAANNGKPVDIDLEEAAVQGGLGAVGEGVFSPVVTAGAKVGRWAVQMMGKMVTRPMRIVLKVAQDATHEKVTARAVRSMRAAEALTSDVDAVAAGVGTRLEGMKNFDDVYKDWNKALHEAAKINDGVMYFDDASQFLADYIEQFREFKHLGGIEVESDARAMYKAMEHLGLDKNDVKLQVIIRKFVLDHMGEIDEREANYFFSKIWKSHKNDSTALRRWKEQFKSHVIRDVDMWVPGAGAAKNYGDRVFAANNEFFKQAPGAKQVIKKLTMAYSGAPLYEIKPGNVAAMIMTKKPDEILQIRNAVVNTEGGQEAWDSLMINYVSGFYRSAMDESGLSGEFMFKPARFVNMIEDNLEKLQAGLSKEGFARLVQETDHFAKISPKLKEIKSDDLFDIFSAIENVNPKMYKAITSGARIAVKEVPKTGLKFMGAGGNAQETLGDVQSVFQRNQTNQQEMMGEVGF